MKIFILGSCVTRDAFNSSLNNSFEISRYIARYSLARIGYDPVKDIDFYSAKMKEKIVSEFQRKLLLQEWANTILRSLEEADFDYVIVDCVDERFGLIEIDSDIFVTNSDEFRNSRVIDSKSAKKVTPDSDVFLADWEKGFKSIIDIVGSDKIIMNNVYWAEKLDNGDPAASNERILYCNKMVSNLYRVAGKYLKNEQFVKALA